MYMLWNSAHFSHQYVGSVEDYWNLSTHEKLFNISDESAATQKWQTIHCQHGTTGVAN